jgi:hypothetical protein
MHKGLNLKREHIAPHHRFTFTHPLTGLYNFGLFPHIAWRGEILASGPIRLQYGEHWGPNRGYGVHHILQEHRRHIPADNDNQILGIVRFVACILTPGADIQCEFSSIRGQHRPLVVRRSQGYVVLMPKMEQEELIYSVITAVPKGNAKGQKVGVFAAEQIKRAP